MANVLANEKQRSWVLSALIAAIIVIPLTKLIAPDLIPFDFFDVWNPHGTHLGRWLEVGLPVFAWGFGITAVITLYAKISGKDIGEAATAMFGDATTKSEMFWAGCKLSAIAGILEEVSFRWFIFYGAFTTVAIGNFLFFGWLGFGIPEWFHLNVWGELANVTTFGYLSQWVFNPTTWLIGAAMLYANAFFRDGHKYLGIVGIVNSWFLGMFFFYVMFGYGLLAAIIIHFIYDWLIFTVLALAWGE